MCHPKSITRSDQACSNLLLHTYWVPGIGSSWQICYITICACGMSRHIQAALIPARVPGWRHRLCTQPPDTMKRVAPSDGGDTWGLPASRMFTPAGATSQCSKVSKLIWQHIHHYDLQCSSQHHDMLAVTVILLRNKQKVSCVITGTKLNITTLQEVLQP